MNRWAQVAVITLLVVIAAILALRPVPPVRVTVDQPTTVDDGCPPDWQYATSCDYRMPTTPTTSHGNRGCPPTWVYANDCGFIWRAP